MLWNQMSLCLESFVPLLLVKAIASIISAGLLTLKGEGRISWLALGVVRYDVILSVLDMV